MMLANVQLWGLVLAADGRSFVLCAPGDPPRFQQDAIADAIMQLPSGDAAWLIGVEWREIDPLPLVMGSCVLPSRCSWGTCRGGTSGPTPCRG
jgi:hypothetical protein